MPTNFYMFFVAAIIPMLVGAVYYNPKVTGNAWMKENNFTTESLEGGNMAKIFGFSYLFSVILAFMLGGLVIHQTSVYQMMVPDIMEAGSTAIAEYQDLMAKYGDHHRSFKHGAIHGILYSIFLVLPIIGINALFERKSFKYIFIHTGYWLLTLALMGGLLCATLKFAALS